MSLRRGFALAETELTSFDGSCRLRCHVQRPDRYRLIEALPPDVKRISRGSGVSYVGAGIGRDSVVQEMGAFNRILAFDAEAGRITVEAGASVGDVVRFARARGWLLAVVPGHPRASIGGCIAADVHGKNPARDGTFRSQVEALELFDPQQGWLVASRSQNAERFAACFAGFGIPGLIANATLRLVPAPQAWSLREAPVADLAAAAELLRSHAGAPILYGWHDGRAQAFGRGVIRFGLEADARVKKARRSANDLPARVEPWPLTAWNRAGIALMNRWLGQRWRRPGSRHVDIESALFPLNAARRYFAGFGPDGMVEAQWLIPHARFGAFAEALGGEVRRQRPRISLIASKLFEGEADGLRFDGSGIALAMHFPQPRETRQAAFLATLAALAIEHGGRPNLIKDSSLDAATLRRAIPEFESIRNTLRGFDAAGVQHSDLTARLEL